MLLQMEDDNEDPISTIVPQGTQEDEIVESEDHHLSFNALKGGRGSDGSDSGCGGGISGGGIGGGDDSDIDGSDGGGSGSSKKYNCQM